jgi:hypothetical protein
MGMKVENAGSMVESHVRINYCAAWSYLAEQPGWLSLIINWVENKPKQTHNATAGLKPSLSASSSHPPI